MNCPHEAGVRLPRQRGGARPCGAGASYASRGADGVMTVVTITLRSATSGGVGTTASGVHGAARCCGASARSATVVARVFVGWCPMTFSVSVVCPDAGAAAEEACAPIKNEASEATTSANDAKSPGR